MFRVARSLAPVAIAAIAYLGASCGKKDPPRPPEPPPLPPQGFVGSERCKACHEERHATWLETAHAYSLRPAGEDTVKGRFDGTPVEAKYFTAVPYRRGKDFHIRIVAKDRRPSGDHRVVHVIGRSLEQAYLTMGAKGEWRVLPICWNLAREGWDLTHEVLSDIAGGAGAPEDYDAREHVFNHGCGQCHATNYDVGYSIEEGIFRSRFLEGAVACESCHGPGAVHEAWHRGKRGKEGYGEPAKLIHPKRDLDPRTVNESCGRCHYLHEWRYAISDDPRVGHDQIAMSRNHDEPGFFVDGTLSGLTYEGTVQAQSPCFLEGGMSCLTCHRMHGGERFGLRFPAEDDRQCTQCHDAMAADHSRHEDVRCVDCHMPRLLSGVLRRTRDHSIRSPDPAMTVRYGIPNACGLCHADRDAAWALAEREKAWGPGDERIRADTALVDALRREPGKVPTDTLAETAARRESRLWFRMTALRHLGSRMDSEKARKTVRAMLEEPVSDYRQLAASILAAQPDPDAAPALVKLLSDPVRTVRVEAAYALARTGWRAARGDAVASKVFLEAEAMFDRQKPFPETLERAIYIADACGQRETMYRHLAALSALGYGSSDPVDLLRRYGRLLAEDGRHAEALDAYSRAAEIAKEAAPDLLYLDSADSLAATGRVEEAQANWTHVADREGAPPDLRLLARSRLGRIAGREFEEARDALRERPAAREVLRRLEMPLAALPGGRR